MNLFISFLGEWVISGIAIYDTIQCVLLDIQSVHGISCFNVIFYPSQRKNNLTFSIHACLPLIGFYLKEKQTTSTSISNTCRITADGSMLLLWAQTHDKH